MKGAGPILGHLLSGCHSFLQKALWVLGALTAFAIVSMTNTGDQASSKHLFWVNSVHNEIHKGTQTDERESLCHLLTI